MIDVGLPIAVIGCLISIYGVYILNQRHDWRGAQRMWMWSNPIFVLYFAGQTIGYWNGGLSSAAMAILYLVMTVSNLHGMWK